MNEIASLYEQINQILLGGKTKWLNDLRKDLINEIDSKGMPNKKKEIWKYSNLAHINNIKYNTQNGKDDYVTKSIRNGDINKIEVINGKYYVPDILIKNHQVLFSNLGESIDHFKNYFFF